MIMVQRFHKKDLKNRYKKTSWISPYKKILALTDDTTEHVELHEYHARNRCIGGSAWEVYHYSRVSPLIMIARREGARNIFIAKSGECKLNLVPGVASAGLEKIEVLEREVKLTYMGLAGGGIAATICRGMAEGVKGIEIYEEGGGNKVGRATLLLPRQRKIVIGVDDTDQPSSGATWSLINEISYDLEKEGFGDYIGHTIVQLYTKNPYKTTNGVSIAVTFAVKNGDENRLVKVFTSNLKRKTLSENTGVAVMKKILPSDDLQLFTKKAKSRLVDIEEALYAAKENIELITFNGNRGLIGAVAALGIAHLPDEAVKVYA